VYKRAFVASEVVAWAAARQAIFPLPKGLTAKWRRPKDQKPLTSTHTRQLK